MRILACLLLLSTPSLAKDIGQLRLTFYTGFEYFEPNQDEADVRLLSGKDDAAFDFNYRKRRFEVPRGRYTLVVEAPGFRPYRRSILVSQAVTDILVGLEISQIADHATPPPPSRIEGHVNVEDVDLGSLWVRVLPVFRPDGLTFDSRVHANGRFSTVLYDPTDGITKYVVLVLAPESSGTDLRVVATREVEVPKNRTTNIEIVLK